MRKSIALAVVMMTAAIATPAQAQPHHSVCAKAWAVRAAVKKQHGHRAPGRNICRFGVKHSNGRVVKATYSQKKRYLFQLRRLAAPGTSPRYPRQKPAGVMSVRVGYVLPYRVVMCESGGDWRAVNHSNPNRPAGAYQIITSTWLGHGGGAFAPTADQATPEEQNIVARRIWRGGAGAGQWECR